MRPTTPPAERVLQAGSFLFKEGERGKKDLFLVREGELQVYTGNANSPTELARLGPGTVVGEVALFDNRPRSASVVATCPTKLSVIPENILLQVFRTMPAWLFAIVKSLCSRLRDTNERMNSSRVQDVPRALALYLHTSFASGPTEYFPCLETFSWLTRVPLGVAQEALLHFVQPGWLRSFNDPATGLRMLVPTVPDILIIFCNYRSCQLLGTPYPPFALDKTSRNIVVHLQTLAALNAVAEPVWLAHLQKTSPHVGVEHLLKCKENALLVAAGDGLLRIDPVQVRLFATAFANEKVIRQIPR